MKSIKYTIAFFAALVFITTASAAYAEWNYGIGTGLFRQNVEGEQGINTVIAGPVRFDVDLDPDTIDDLTKSAFGFNGYLTDGAWVIQYSFLNIELEGKESRTVPGFGLVSARIGFEITGGELTAAYPVYQNPSLVLKVLGGVRYTRHELSGEIVLGGSSISRNIDNKWTDALVGVTANVPFADKWSWNSRIDAGFGGSEGTYTGSTGVTWRFAKSWSSTLFGKFSVVDFENDSEGDSDWYLYDADEFGAGLSFLYHW